MAVTEQPLNAEKVKVHFIQLSCFFLSPPGLQMRDDEEDGRGRSVEEDGVRIPVGNLRHVFQDVFFSDYSQQPPDETERERERERESRSHPSSWKVTGRRRYAEWWFGAPQSFY